MPCVTTQGTHIVSANREIVSLVTLAMNDLWCSSSHVRGARVIPLVMYENIGKQTYKFLAEADYHVRNNALKNIYAIIS